MQLRYRLVLPLMAVCLALVVAPAFAAKPGPTLEPLPQGTVIPGVSITSAPCFPGNLEPPVYFAQFIFPPNDQYYQYLDPSQCGVCPTGTYVLSVAHMLLYWPSDCQLPVLVSVVGSTGGACPAPDPTNVICAATLYPIDGAGGPLKQHDFALPPGCCISGPAFLCVNFLQSGNCSLAPSGLTSPYLLIDGTGDACQSYNIYPADPIARDLVTYYGFPGNLNMWADADCCPPTSTLPGSWGMLKTLYR